mmetsp:Transcript_150515/g.481808  ORF Transcript_150515/g.481808 Transcript_150515/m.481808 type:complete len:330 (+) Transcript_150515:131-1120(+)
MWWMLYNHNPSGRGLSDNLQSWNYGNHSLYLATIAARAQEHWGFEFTSVEPLNEPIADWWKPEGTQEGCHFDHSTQAMILNRLRSEMDKLDLDAVVSGSDENTYDEGRATWASFDETTKSNIGKVNVHGYQGAEGRRDLLYQDVAGKRLWNSEYGDGDGSGKSLASNLNLDFRLLHNTAWCYWQFADESDGWGLLKFDSSSFKIQQANTKYWVLAQYARHIRPGMMIIDGGESNTIAAYDPSEHLLVLVTTSYDSNKSVTYDLSQFGEVRGPITQWTTNFADGGERYVERKDVALADKAFASTFTADTVRTFEVQNVKLTSSMLVELVV